MYRPRGYIVKVLNIEQQLPGHLHRQSHPQEKRCQPFQQTLVCSLCMKRFQRVNPQLCNLSNPDNPFSKTITKQRPLGVSIIAIADVV